MLLSKMLADWIGDHPDHYPLPSTLEADLEDHRRDDLELKAIEQDPWAALLPFVLRRAAKSVEPFGPPAYHNGEHFATVVRNVANLMTALTDLSLYPESVTQGMMLAAAGHDFAHQGSTLRRDAPGEVARPDLGMDISTEEVSALLIDEILRHAGVDVAMRLFVCRHIWATTFGNPNVRPITRTEHMIALADVVPVLPPFQLYMQGIQVIYREVPPGGKRPTTMTEWLTSRKGFTGYVRSLLEKVPMGKFLGWEENLDAYDRMLDKDANSLSSITGHLFPKNMIDLGK